MIRNAKQDLSVASSLFDDGDYENAQKRARDGLEVCEDIRSINETFDVEDEDVDDLEEQLEQLSRQVDTVLSAVDEANAQQQAVERALQSRDHEVAENALEELEHQIDILAAKDADEEIVADLRTSANNLEHELAIGQADGRVTGLLGSAMSSYSTAAKLLEEGEQERSLRRLESAHESLNEASTLNQEYDLGRSDSIREKHEKVSELLDEVNEAPQDTLQEQLVEAESAVARGIDARETDAVDAAVEAFTNALETYEEAREVAAENDLDAVWEVEQRVSMTEEYLEVARSELEDRQHAVRNDLNQILENGESALVIAEQHEEVDDPVSAREAFEETTSMLDDAAQLIETGLATDSQEDRYETLDKRANKLESRLPESSTGEYRNRDLIDALQRLTIKLEESPRPEFVNKYGEYPAEAYLTAFGSWSDALAAANLDPIDETTRERRTYSRTEVLDALVDVIDDLGRPPSRTEMNAKGTVSSTTVKNRFEDWETALELAESTRNSDESEAERGEHTDADELMDGPETEDPESTDEIEEDDILGQIESELNEL
ncbi:homing endonuclease associated repeat-containing protein [Halobacterium hubeiense]|uniref:homing endonuclease associated repeat-containing protein n=1 Tax=Halobacterium hubeiense TaxID=1407499 RepID=UPI003C75D87F